MYDHLCTIISEFDKKEIIIWQDDQESCDINCYTNGTWDKDEVAFIVNPKNRVVPQLVGDDSDKDAPKRRRRVWWRYLVSGAIAGAASRTFTAPLDRIKLFLQVDTHHRNIREACAIMYREGGLKSFWRGNAINVMKIAPENALKFGTFEIMKFYCRGMDEDGKRLNVLDRLISGATAGAISQSAIYPLEVLKTRITLQDTHERTSIIRTAVDIAKTEGFRVFYKGFVPNILGIMPYAGVELATYETLKKTYRRKYKTQDPSAWVLSACSSVSSALGQLVAYPFALIRTRMQTYEGRKKLGMRSVISHIYRHSGIFGFFHGLLSNYLKVLPAVSINFVVYEKMLKFFYLTSST